MKKSRKFKFGKLPDWIHGKTNCESVWRNPVEMLRSRMGELGITEQQIEHITFDPDLSKDYTYIRSHSHDGLLYFTREMENRALMSLVNKITRHIRESVDWKTCDVKYTVGYLKLSTFFCYVSLPCSDTAKYPGCKERIRVPICCEYSSLG